MTHDTIDQARLDRLERLTTPRLTRYIDIDRRRRRRHFYCWTAARQCMAVPPAAESPTPF